MSHEIQIGFKNNFSGGELHNNHMSDLTMVKAGSKKHTHSHEHDNNCHESSHKHSSLYTLSETGEAPTLEEHKEILKNAGSLEFNIFKFSQDIGRDKAFILLPMHFMATLKLDDHLDIDEEKFVKFGEQIYSGYRRDVEYHNDIHGLDVMQFAYVVLTKFGLIKLAELTSLDILSTLVAAACHDYGHDGVNNVYHVNTISDRAITYSDHAV